MLKIKLSPLGKKHEPHYRIIVVEENSKLTGDKILVLGHYHPMSKELVVDKKLVADWIAKGAQPTDRVKRLLKI